MIDRHPATAGPRPSRLLRLWLRLPVVVRAIVAGELVVSACGLVPDLFMVANLKLTPRIPWLLPASAAWLWLCWRWLNGWGNPPTGLVWQTGFDRGFVIALAAFLLCGLAAVPAFRRLAAVTGVIGAAGVTGVTGREAPAAPGDRRN